MFEMALTAPIMDKVVLKVLGSKTMLNKPDRTVLLRIFYLKWFPHQVKAMPRSKQFQSHDLDKRT